MTDFGKRSWETKSTGILLVRHPLTRLYSSWSNRFYKSKSHHYGTQIKLIKSNFTEKSDPPPPESMAVTFQAFLRFVVSDLMWSRNDLKNGHWLPISELCNPCELRYHIIINQEAANEQTRVFLEGRNLTQYRLVFRSFVFRLN